MKKFIIKLLTVFCILFLFSAVVNAQSSNFSKFKAKITDISNKSCTLTPDQTCTIYTVQPKEALEGREITIETPQDPHQNMLITYKTNDLVFVQTMQTRDQIVYEIAGHVRENSIYALVFLFVIVTLLIGKTKGLGAIVGLIVSIFTIFGIITPLVIKGYNPYLIGVPCILVILISSIYLSHGFNKQSTIALISTLIGLIITGIIAFIFLALAKISGVGNDEAYFLMVDFNRNLSMKSIVFLSVLIGGIGIIDDVAINQVTAMQEIKTNNPSISQLDLFKSAMRIGTHHISSMVNTLFIAYTASSMTLIMIMQARHITLNEIINDEYFAEEIIRTIVASIGLILVVPITSYIASILLTKQTIKVQ
jgi:uncharacterized membrane protein